MGERLHLKKVFLIVMIFALIVSALMAVVIFLAFDFGEVEMKLIGTTLSIGLFSLIGLFFANLYEKGENYYFSVGGMILVVTAFVVAVLLIWEANHKVIWSILTIGYYFAIGLLFYWMFFIKKDLKVFSGGALFLTVIHFFFRFLYIWEVIDQSFYVKVSAIVWIIGLSLLHVALIWLANSDEGVVRASMYFTFLMIMIVGVMLAIWVLSWRNAIDLGEYYYRVLGAFAILDGLGTVVTPILVKVMGIHRGQRAPAQPTHNVSAPAQ